jgi:peptidoglycan pentaglycine glycine transferase (the first glycine)
MDRNTWNSIISNLTNPHILQSWEWGKVKSEFGWQPIYRQWNAGSQAACMILQRTISLGQFATPLRVLYAPKGPLLDWSDNSMYGQVLDDLQDLARVQGAIFIKIDPDIQAGTASDNRVEPLGEQIARDLKQRGWVYSQDQIQFQNTVVVDLEASDDELLERMKPKTRYNIRLAQRKGVNVRAGSPDDYPLLYRMYAETSVRDGFAIREEGYYRAVWQAFSQQGMAEALIAQVENEPVAGLFLFYFAGKAWYLYGMSRELHREKMPNYLLQWKAMLRAREKGCKLYDLWGAPSRFDESDPLWGVYRFKAGLGGIVIRTLGAWDFPARPLLYRFYTQTLPHIMSMMRRRGASRTQERIRSTIGNP